jgi:hypothetical protein
MNRYEHTPQQGRRDGDPELDADERALVVELKKPVAVDGATFDARVMSAVRFEASRWSQTPRTRGARVAGYSVACAALAAAIAIIVIRGSSIRDADINLPHAGVVTTPQAAVRSRPAVAGAAGVGQPAGAEASSRSVRFTLVASGASRVAVAGSFNGWNISSTPLHRIDRDTWSAEIPLGAGRYVYQFVIDGKRWVPDPRAPRDAGDDFGASNSVVTVASTGSA